MQYYSLMTAPQPKEILTLAQQIVTLEEQLAAAKGKWNLLFNVAQPTKRTRSLAPDGLTARLLEFIAGSSGVAFTIRAVAEAVKEDELPVGRTLYRLAKTGRIANPQRGIYMSQKEEDKNEAPA
jgi:hypothetical protein